jgi:hypothetical protein
MRMAPSHSPDQPDRPASHRITVPVSYDMVLRDPKLVAIPRADMERFIRDARDLDGRSNPWFAGGWSVLGIAVSLGGVAFQAHLLELGLFAILLFLFALGCFRFNREFRGTHEDRAEKLAQEMEGAIDVDNLPMPPFRR